MGPGSWIYLALYITNYNVKHSFSTFCKIINNTPSHDTRRTKTHSDICDEQLKQIEINLIAIMRFNKIYAYLIDRKSL